jgi:hypothetical protein
MSGRHGSQRRKHKPSKRLTGAVVAAEAPCQEHPDNRKGDYMEEAKQNPSSFLRDWRVDAAAILVSLVALVAYFTQASFMRKAMRVDQRAWISARGSAYPSQIPFR